MKYCPKCGTECNDTDKFCTACGNRLDNNQNNYINETNNDSNDQSRALGIISIILAVVGLGLIGLIIGIIGVRNATNDTAKGLCIAGIIVSALELIAALIVIILVLTGVIAGFTFYYSGF